MMNKQFHGWMLFVILLLVGCSQQGEKATNEVHVIETPTSRPEIVEPVDKPVSPVEQEVIESDIDESQETVESDIDESQETVESDIDESQETVESDIDESQETVESNIDESQETVESDIDESQETIESDIDESQEIIETEVIEVTDDVIPNYPRFLIKVIHNDLFAPNKLISLGIEITNSLDKDIEHFDGHVIIYDNQNNLLGSLDFVDNNILKLNFFRHRYYLQPQQTKVWGLGVREEDMYTFYHGLLDKRASQLKAEFIVTLIKYTDGTRDIF